MSKITLEQLEYVPLSDSEVDNLKQFEDKFNKNRNKEVYLLAFEKDK